MGRYHFSAVQRKTLEELAQPLGIFQFLNKRVVTVVLSDGFCDVFGYDTREQAYYDMENNMYKYAHPDDVARIANAAFRFATEGGTYEVVYRTRSPRSNDYRIIHAMGRHIFTDDGTRLAHVWYTDEGTYAGEGGSQRTELNRAFNSALHEESLVRESNYDYLTGLPNMTYFFDLAENGMNAIQRTGAEPALLYMDFSGMKFFNTQNSYEEGDHLLRAFALTLKDTFGDRNCCRIGADHFAAYTVEHGLEDTLVRFLQACKRTNHSNNLPVHVGVYPWRVEHVSVSTACDRAKYACDSLRDTYGSRFAYFDTTMLESARRRRYVLANLDRAIAQGWIHVHYQPIVRAVNGRVCDEEALSRWFDPNLGQLSPADFIPTLEDAGIIYKLDLYVLEQVLLKMRLQREAGLFIVPCSINLSRSDFTACDIVEEIRRRVDATDIGRDMIAIEITESTVGNNQEFMTKQVRRFQSLGFRVWMDDFGSGYSSVDLLQSLEFDLVKFDMSFMRLLDKGNRAKIVLTELVKMATSLGADTLCEGIETKEQVRFLQEIGCSKLQGYYYNRPIPYEAILKRYQEGRQIGFENPDESEYYETVGRLNLYDLSTVASEEDVLRHYFDVLPMGVVEIDGDWIELVRANQSYRDFIERFLSIDVDKDSRAHSTHPDDPDASFVRVIRQCCESGGRAFHDNTMPDGSVIHSFVRFIATNPVTGRKAAAVAVLSILDQSGNRCM